MPKSHSSLGAGLLYLVLSMQTTAKAPTWMTELPKPPFR
jgi:hypothetical protein